MRQIRTENTGGALRGFRSRIALALAIILLFSSVCVPAMSAERASGGRTASERIQRRVFSDKRDNDGQDSPGRDDGNEKPAGEQEIHTVTPGQELPGADAEREPGLHVGGENDLVEKPPVGGEGNQQEKDPPAGEDETQGGEVPGSEAEDQTEADPGEPEEIREQGDRRADVETAKDWEQMFADMKFTGDWDTDFLNVVFSQLGYTASWRNFTVDKQGVRQNYTRYGAWFGFPYGAWCAMFVSFCLHYAGIPKDAMLQSASVNRMVEWLRDRDRYRFDWDHYSPKPGDLVFFSYGTGRMPTHVGVVYGVMNSTLLTVEGNNGPTVAMFTYDIHDPTIVGYGIFPDQTEYYRSELSAAETEIDPASAEQLALIPEPAADGLTVMGKTIRKTH